MNGPWVGNGQHWEAPWRLGQSWTRRACCLKRRGARTGQPSAHACSVRSYRWCEKMQKRTLLHYIVH